MNKLNKKNLKQFLTYILELRSPAYFKTAFSLGAKEVEQVKTNLGIKGPEDARKLIKKIALEEEKEKELKTFRPQPEVKMVEVNTIRKEKNKIDVVAIREKEHVAAEKLKARKDIQSEWRLPSDIKVETFKNDIESVGFAFCKKKYNVSRKDIIAEAERLKLKIKWNIVKK